MTILKICGRKFIEKCGNFYITWDMRDTEEFFVPLSNVRVSQHSTSLKRNDRLLSVGHRCRGDVGVIA